MVKVNLGDKVKDIVTGYEGIAVARTEWLYGCIRILVQAKVDKSGDMPEARIFDEPQLKIIKQGAVPNVPALTISITEPSHGERDDKAATAR